MTPIKWAAFDLDDTLFNGTNLVLRARRAAVKMMIDYGLPVDIDVAIRLLDEIVIQFGSNSEEHLDYLMVRLQNDPNIKLSPKYNINKYVAAGVIGYHREKVKHFHPFKDVVKTFNNLKKIGIKIALITDGNPKKQYEKILRLKIGPFFDEIIISDEIGIRKPNKALLELFLNRVGAKPNEVIYVGDRVDKDIIPAKEAGIVSVLIHRGTKHDPFVKKVRYGIQPDYHINSLYELINIIKEKNDEE